jgi:hypothetical protein
MLTARTAGFGASLLLAACTGLVGDAGGGAGSATTADASSTLSLTTNPIRRLRRLSSREYNNVVRDLLGDTSQPANQFLHDSYVNGYDNGSAALAVQSDQAASYQLAAEKLAASAVTNNLSGLVGGCDVMQQTPQACLQAFLSTFAPRAYRRPLTATELQRLQDAFQAGAQAADFVTGIQTALEVILQSPQFLYREELGPPGAMPTAKGVDVQLTDYEVASELSFLLTGSLPDLQLWAAVEQGHFRSAADRQREAARLLASPSARDALRAFLHEWMGTYRLSDLSKDPKFYPTFNSTLAASMSGELDRFFDEVLWAQSGSLRELFTSNQSFVDQRLGQLYLDPVMGLGFQPVMLDPQLRKGILTRAGYLAVHSDVDSSGPIARGVFVLQSILCSPPPPPPANVPPATPASDPAVKDVTTRTRFDQHVSSAFCASCHTTIDGMGFGFEEFDGIGAYRTSENGNPVDTSGKVYGTGEIDGSYVGVSQLAIKLAGSHHLVDCYTKQAYRYAMGQVEPSGSDLHSLNSLSTLFSADARLTDMLLNIVAAPMFVTRVSEPPSP